MAVATAPSTSAEPDAASASDAAAGGADPGATRFGMSRRQRRVFLTLVVASFAVRVALAVSQPGPILSDDGTGYLGNARWLAGASTPDFTGSNLYAVGYSIVLAPLYLARLSPSQIMVGVQVVNAILATLIVFPLGAALRRMRPELGGWAYGVGLVVSLTPALVLQPAFAWPESLLPLLFATWVLTAFRLVQDRRRGDALLLGTAAFATAAVHDRALGVLLATALLLVAHAVVVRRRPGSVAEHVGALVLMVAGTLAVRALTATLVDTLWQGAPPVSAGRVSSMMDKVVPPGLFVSLQNLAGQSWYLAASTLGLVVLGVGVALWLARPPALGGRSRHWMAWGAVALAAAVILATSATFIRGPRVDHAIYGRYNEVWSPVFVAIGLGWFILWPPRERMRRALIGLAVLLLAGIGLLVVLPAGRMSGDVMVLNVLGILGLETLFRGDFRVLFDGVSVIAVSILAGVLLVLIALAGYRGRTASVVVAGAAFLELALLAHYGTVSVFRDSWYGHLTTIVRAVDESGVPDDEPIAYDVDHPSQAVRNVMQFWLGDDRLVFVEGTEDVDTTLVVSRDETLADRCYERVAVQEFGDQWLWRLDPACDPS